MDKKAVAEVKKCFQKNNCRIDRMRACFVNEEKEKLSVFHDSFLALEEREMTRYLEIFKKSLSGKFGRNLFNLSFPLTEEEEGGRQHFLYRLLRSELKDEILLSQFFDRVIESASLPGKYLILLIHAVYDIPAKTTDGLTLEDASENVYSFLLASVCPVSLLREGLCYDSDQEAFLSRTDDWAVQKPEMAFLYPSFNDRNTDLHESLYYSRHPENRQDSFAGSLLGIPLPRAEKAQKKLFRNLVENSFGRGLSFDVAKQLSEQLIEKIQKSEEEDQPAALEPAEFRRMMAESGADETQLRRFEADFREAIKEDDSPILAETLVNKNSFQIQSDNVKLSVKSEVSDILETRIIDGREYLLIPVSDNITVNGLTIRREQQHSSMPQNGSLGER